MCFNYVYFVSVQQLNWALLKPNRGQGQRLIGNSEHSVSVCTSRDAFADDSFVSDHLDTVFGANDVVAWCVVDVDNVSELENLKGFVISKNS